MSAYRSSVMVPLDTKRTCGACGRDVRVYGGELDHEEGCWRFGGAHFTVRPGEIWGVMILELPPDEELMAEIEEFWKNRKKDKE